MPDVQTMFYHGVRQNIRRVLVALGPDRIEKGLTAFEDGASSWSQCFFARAFAGEADLTRYTNPTDRICELLDDPTYKLRVPVKIVWHTFDLMHGNRGAYGRVHHLTRDGMRKFIEDVLDEFRPQEVMDLLRGINYTDVEKKEFSCATT